MFSIFSRVMAGVFGLVLCHAAASAQDSRQNEPGKFDFYVLALSWSPSFCEQRGERAPRMQCGERPYSFVVHGLWPEYERLSGISPAAVAAARPRHRRPDVDLTPAPRLVYNEWDKHGDVLGLNQRAYFEAVRKARAFIKIPAEYMDIRTPTTVSPDEVEEAFVKANPGLTRTGIAVTCNSHRLGEVRICLTRELAFRECGTQVDKQQACRRDKLVMPPLRGG